MSRTEDFDSEFWDDPAIEALSIEATILYIWTWTNSRIGPAGLYKATRRAMSESKVPAERLSAALAELEEADLAFYDDTYVWVKARVKRLRTRTVAMCRGIAKAVAKVPEDHPYRVAFMERYGSQVWTSGDRATTIAQEVDAVSRGETGVSPGSDPGKPFPLGNRGSHPRKSSTYKGKGKGYGNGRGHMKFKFTGASSGEFDDQFPGVDPNLVRLICKQLREDGRDPTVDAIRAELDKTEREAA